MRRIAVVLLSLGLVAAHWACSSDAPTPTLPPGGGPKPGPSPLLITLFTTDANPPAGFCTLVQAIVTFNGQAVADGIGVQFSTTFGTFAENSTPVVSVVTTKGSAIATLCSTATGTAFVTASATVNGVSAKSDQLKIVFQPSASPAPFITNCVPAFGSNGGGTTLVINGGRFPGTSSGATAMFTAAGVTREGLVTSVTPTAVTVVTPAFPEATAPSVPVNITLNLSGVTVTVPNCFAFGTASSGTPTITALLPATGSKDGNTRVSIIGSGFSAPLQVFFGTVEATVVSVSFNQVVVLSPPTFAFGGTPPPINTAIDVRVHEVTSGVDATLVGGWRYTLPLVITGISPLSMRADQIGTLTIFGHGFQSPVLVTIGGNRATLQSVSDSEILVVPASPTSCGGGGGAVTVFNLGTGESATSPQSFTLVAVTPTITSIVPTQGAEGSSVTINGTNLPTSAGTTTITFGAVTATATSFSPNGTSITVTAPSGAATAAACPSGTPAGTPIPATLPTTIRVTNTATTCSVTGTFTYLLPCTVAPDLAITKSGPASVLSGSNLVYTITVSNGGSGSASGVVMTDALPAGETFVSCTTTAGTCTNSGGTVTGSLGALPAGSAATVTLTVTVTAPAGSIIGNTANVSTSTPEPNLSNNSSSVSTTVQ